MYTLKLIRTEKKLSEQEKLKEKGKTKTRVRGELIADLLKKKVKLHSSLIEEFGEIFRFHPKTRGNLFDIYDTFTDEALEVVYDCFVERKLDPRGRFLEYRFAQWLAEKDKEINKIAIDKNISSIGEIDVVGYDKYGKIISIAECKARKSKASKEDIDPWLRSVELVFNFTRGSLRKAYFVNVAGFTDGIKERMLEDKRISENGFFLLEKSPLKIVKGEIIIGFKNGVNIYLCEERSGQLRQVFP